MTTQELYDEMLKFYNRTSTKKAFLTRAKKQCEEHLADLVDAYERGGWLHGKVVGRAHIREVENEIETINKKYAEL